MIKKILVTLCVKLPVKMENKIGIREPIAEIDGWIDGLFSNRIVIHLVNAFLLCMWAWALLAFPSSIKLGTQLPSEKMFKVLLSWATVFMTIVFGAVFDGLHDDKSLSARRVNNYATLSSWCWTVSGLLMILEVSKYENYWALFLSILNTLALLAVSTAICFKDPPKTVRWVKNNKLFVNVWAIIFLVAAYFAMACRYPYLTKIIDAITSIYTVIILGYSFGQITVYPFSQMVNKFLVSLSVLLPIIYHIKALFGINFLGNISIVLGTEKMPFVLALPFLYKFVISIELFLLLDFYGKKSELSSLLRLRKSLYECGDFHNEKARNRAINRLNEFLNFSEDTVFSSWKLNEKERLKKFIKTEQLPNLDIPINSEEQRKVKFWKVVVEVKKESFLKGIQAYQLDARMVYLIIYAALTNNYVPDDIPKDENKDEKNFFTPEEVYQLTAEDKKMMNENVRFIEYDSDAYWNVVQTIYDLFKNISESRKKQGGYVYNITFMNNELTVHAKKFNIKNLNNTLEKHLSVKSSPISDRVNSVTSNLLKLQKQMEFQEFVKNDRESVQFVKSFIFQSKEEEGTIDFIFDFNKRLQHEQPKHDVDKKNLLMVHNNEQNAQHLVGKALREGRLDEKYNIYWMYNEIPSPETFEICFLHGSDIDKLTPEFKAFIGKIQHIALFSGEDCNPQGNKWRQQYNTNVIAIDRNVYPECPLDEATIKRTLKKFNLI